MAAADSNRNAIEELGVSAPHHRAHTVRTGRHPLDLYHPSTRNKEDRVAFVAKKYYCLLWSLEQTAKQLKYIGVVIRRLRPRLFCPAALCELAFGT